MEAATTIARPQIQQPHMPQHMEALAEANRVRLARAALKRAVLNGGLDPAEVVRECPWEVQTMSVGELMRSQRRWGRTRTRKFLDSMSLSENRQLGRLTLRQRSLLASELDAKRGIIHS